MNAGKNPGGITEISPEVADPGIQYRNIPCIPAGMPEVRMQAKPAPCHAGHGHVASMHACKAEIRKPV
jgi:hypothetical protein